MYAIAGHGDEEVTVRRCDSTGVRAIQCRSRDRKSRGYLFTTLAITAMHLPSLLLVPHNGIVRVIQSPICIRINLERSVDRFRLGSGVDDQQDRQPATTAHRALYHFIPPTAFELHVSV